MNDSQNGNDSLFHPNYNVRSDFLEKTRHYSDIFGYCYS